MDARKTLFNELKKYLTAEHITPIYEAYLFAKQAHGEQRRYTGELYITHPLTVAYILAQARMDPATISAAILHDVLEDTPVKPSELAQHFGKEITDLVDGVTKLTQIHFETYAQAQAENFHKMVMAMASDIRIILIKLCDRLHNMRTLSGLPIEKQRRKSVETLEIFAPIANRLGMHTVRVELENLGFAALYPLRYRVLQAAMIRARDHRKEIIQTIYQDIQQHFKKAAIYSVQLTGREKHLYSIYQKMHQKHLSFSEIMDVYGFRVVVRKIDECYRVLGVLHNLYKPIPDRFKDYIAIPKANGYQSLHTTLFGPYGVPIEIQIRTKEMHQIAEKGIAAHWLYKSTKHVPHTTQCRAQEWLNRIAEMGKSSKNHLEFIENVKIDLFPDEVYVFTPKGQIIELPAGATPVDFAYAIHSDIGNTCVAARLNKHLLPLSTALTSGQRVEIVTAPGAKPNPAWLHFAVTGKAHSNIKYYLKKQQQEEFIELGKELLNKALHPFNLQLNQFTTTTLDLIAHELQLDSPHRLFEEVGMGHRPAVLLAKYFIQSQNSHPFIPKTPAFHQPLMIKGTEGLVLTYSHCCQPIPGDPIAGLMKVGQGIEVHTALCPHLIQYQQQADKYVSLAWEDNITSVFPVDLKIDLMQQSNSLASLLLSITESQAHIISLQAQEHDPHYFHVEMTLAIRNRIHLAKVLRKIRQRKDITRVLRRKIIPLRRPFHHKTLPPPKLI